METLLAASATFDNRIRAQRCSAGMLAKLKQGLWPWKSALGYRRLQVRKHGLKRTEPDPPDEKIFPIIQKALKEFAKGLYSETDIVRMLKQDGLEELSGRKVTSQSVDKMLSKYLRFYAGILVNPWAGPGEEREITGLHKPMITREELYQIQAIKSGKKVRFTYDRYNPEFPLRRLILCASCNETMTGSSPRGNGGKYSYYHCKSKDCERFGKSLDKVTVEKDFVAYLQKITPNEDFLAVFNETVIDFWNEEKGKISTETNKYDKQISALEARKKRICEMREEGSYTIEEFKERKEEIDNQIMAARISRNESNIDQLDIETTLTYATNCIRDLGRQWFDVSPLLKRQFQKRVLPEGVPYSKENKFGTAKLGYIYELNREYVANNSNFVVPRGIEPLFCP